ncbi:MAG: hypothetical protein CMD68_02580 [Gammaproteobacteria bacterium]|nr:hypothetical protein [Gammaproteobacteria bacterium]
MVKAVITAKILRYDSLLLAGVYTVGHIFIAMTCTLVITGTSLNLAALDALIEPIINGFWFYFLHKAWKKFSDSHAKSQDSIA